MSDTEWKLKALVGLQPTSPALGGLRPNSVMRFAPFGAVMRAQDTVPATSRRIVASWSLSGAVDWAQPAGTVDPGVNAPTGHVYPANDVWRTLGTFRSKVTPGCELWAHVLYCPAGLVQRDVGGGVNFEANGAWAEFRVQVEWASAGNTILGGAGTAYTVLMEGSTKGTYGGLENTGRGQNWTTLQRKRITGMRQPSFVTDPAVAAEFSEWPDTEIILSIRGGARVVAAVVYEMPKAHVTEHDYAGLTSVVAMPAGLGKLTPVPMVKSPDGATYEEHRFGTLRMMQVAERQSERLGPRPFQLTTWREDSHDVTADTEGDAITTTSATFVDLFDSTITTWSVDNPGFIIAGSHAQLHRLTGTLIGDGDFAVIPVRVRVDAGRSAGTGTVRIQTSLNEWVDVAITGARGWYTAVGYLRSQVFPDESIATAQVFIRTTAGTLSIYGISVDFNWWPT